MKNLKLLNSFATEFEAQLVQTKLEEQGIETMIQAEDRANVLPSLDYSNGVSLYVEPEDYDRAIALITTTDDDLTDDMDTSGTAPSANGI
jgi:hypothetical protein